jgi:hypothetical protein
MWKKKAKTQSSPEEIDLVDEDHAPEDAEDPDNQDVIDHTPDFAEPMEAEPKVAEEDPITIEELIEDEAPKVEEEPPADASIPAKVSSSSFTAKYGSFGQHPPLRTHPIYSL